MKTTAIHSEFSMNELDFMKFETHMNELGVTEPSFIDETWDSFRVFHTSSEEDRGVGNVGTLVEIVSRYFGEDRPTVTFTSFEIEELEITPPGVGRSPTPGPGMQHPRSNSCAHARQPSFQIRNGRCTGLGAKQSIKMVESFQA